MVIEDQSGRVKLASNDALNPCHFVTGTVLAVKGAITSNGFFEPVDWTYAGMPSIDSMPEQFNEVDENLQLGIFDNLENRDFIAFISGIQFDNGGPTCNSVRLSQWISGETGSDNDRLLSKRISRVVIGGNNLGEETDINEVIKGSFVTHDINEKVYSHVSNSIDDFENFIVKVSDKCDVDIMPGDNDLSGAFFPQQKMNVALFPSLLKNNNILFSTNPHMFLLNGLLFLGTSGQNLEDI